MSEDEMLDLALNLKAQRDGTTESEKATILMIGTIDPETGYPMGWVFNYAGRSAAAIEIEIGMGVVRVGGYTLDELAEIWKRGTP